MNFKNRLANEKSPYLLQHAENPVDWYPWGEEAFEKARRENKPVFLSIGYSTCHWCHVMAHESFEDPEVARLLNEGFVSIKVDREERPDIDAVYMAVCQALTGSGGWPLSVFLTPEKKPFFAGTYFPKKSRYGHIGMLDLLPKIREIWLAQKEKVSETAEEITEYLKKMHKPQEDTSFIEFNEAIFEKAYLDLKESFDSVFGGFGWAPKFPLPFNILFLLRYWRRTKDPHALFMAEKTLEAMRFGGIFDQLGFGFHRYSVDQEWLVPHFEKMLYDQALLAIAYLEAFQATKKAFYGRVAEEVLTYVLRDLRDPDGAFYASQDADSEGEEGKFYLWTDEEIRNVLPPKEAEEAILLFGILPEGNFQEEVTQQKSGKNILHLSKLPSQKIDEESFEKIRKILFEARQMRTLPHRDEKILTDWNGLMISALARAGAVLNKPYYLHSAKKAASFILEKLSLPTGRLLHRFAKGESKIPAMLNDYAFFIHGLLDLYEASFEEAFLDKAISLNEILLKEFWDEKEGGFYFTSLEDEVVLVRIKEFYDNAAPSGNAVALSNLFRISRLTNNSNLEKKIKALLTLFSNEVLRAPRAFCAFLCILDFFLAPPFTITIFGNHSNPTVQEMMQTIHKVFLPNKVLRFSSGQNKEGQAVVCVESQCFKPVFTAASLLELLEGKPSFHP